MSLTMTTFGALLKRRNTDKKIQNLTLNDNPLLAWLSKDPNFSGEAMKIPLIYGNPQGLAAQSLGIAQGSSSNLKSKYFLITTGDYFGTVDISRKVMMASRDNPGAFLSSKTAEIDALHEQMGSNLNLHCWGNGGGAIGRRASLSSQTITLSEPSTVYAFSEGMTIACSTGDGSSTSDALKAGTTTVTAVDFENGKITVDNIDDIISDADNDYIFRYGDFLGNTGTGIIQGIQQYIYSTSTAVPDLFGMVRSTHPTYLAGSRLLSTDLTGLNIEERIKRLGSRMVGRYGAKMFDAGFLNPEDWQTLEIQLNSRGTRSATESKTSFGFSTLTVRTGGGEVTVMADRGCPKGHFFGLRKDNWTLWSMGELVHTVDGDGLTMLRKTDSNDFEYRLEAFPQLSNNAPLNSGRCPL